ncbi:hypothetical protein GCM10027572_08520 [Flexivirga lutea]
MSAARADLEASDHSVTVRGVCNNIKLADLANVADGEFVTVAGALRHMQLKRNMAGELWASLTIAEHESTVTVLVFVRTFATIDRESIVPDRLVRVTGRLYRRDDGSLRISASTVTPQPDV